MGRVHRSFLPGTRIYACSNCRAHLTNHEDIVSKSFQGRTGRAYLFNTVVNVTLGPVEDRILTTGLHKVCTLSTSKASASSHSDAFSTPCVRAGACSLHRTSGTGMRASLWGLARPRRRAAAAWGAVCASSARDSDFALCAGARHLLQLLRPLPWLEV